MEIGPDQPAHDQLGKCRIRIVFLLSPFSLPAEAVEKRVVEIDWVMQSS